MEDEKASGNTRRSRRRKSENAADQAAIGEGQPNDREVVRHAGQAVSADPEPQAPTDDLCPVVGVGASAGGLGAFERFCKSMPAGAETTVALILVQHLDPNRKSMLSDLIRQYTRMKVFEVKDGMEVEPGCAYIIPPNKDMALVQGKLRLLEPSMPRGLRLPIDFFFRSLAQDRREKAIGVILSGTGTDGTLGLKAIKEGGGLVIAQTPESAQYDGMPRSAIATTLVDYILPPEEMPERLFGYIQHAFSKQVLAGEQKQERDARQIEPMQRVFLMLRSQTGHDFSRYKRNTIIRRIERRMAVHQTETVEAYVGYLQQNPAEVGVLFRELLIGVTNFFRDAEAFAVLEQRVIPALFTTKRSGEAVRVWVPGCSTGEEAYSIAMLLQEHMSKIKTDVRAQIFATDIDSEAIDQARAAIFPNSIAADVSAERLARFFSEEGSTYHVKKAIRDMIVFAEQNVADDPPFSHIDLISCRNLLIYMDAELQRRVLPLFHYALSSMGYLFLGSSESIGEFSDLFTPLDRKWKIFVRKAGGMPQRAALDFARANVGAEPLPRRVREARQETRMDLRQMTEQALLGQHTPSAAVVNAEGDVQYIHGRTGYYLEPAAGEASHNVLRMAREGLRLELATALRKAVARQDKVVRKELAVRANGGFQTINLVVRPMGEASGAGLYLIVFEPVAVGVQSRGAHEASAPGEDKERRISVLERELQAKEENLQTTIEELETSNEELTSANEELQSANEELQSTNEELETSKEELQSVNEELLTVNMELQKKIEEVSRANNDLNNLLAGTGIGTVFVDHRLRIQRFTPAITEIINLIQTDLGRPVAHIVSNLENYTDLIKDITSVLDTLVPQEREVLARNGRWYLMRIQPYRTLENVIEGAVLTFVDIASQKKMQDALNESRHLRIETIFDPGLIVDGTGELLDWNQDALALFGYQHDEITVLRLSDLVTPDKYWLLRQAIEAIEPGKTKTVSLAFRKKDGTDIPAQARVRTIDGATGDAVLIVMQPEREPGVDGPDR